VTVVSIFVNPLQFGPGEDLERYPKTPEADLRYLDELGADLLFLPAASDIYPPGFSTRVEMTDLTGVLCGASRPGHFSGVLTVVLKLLNMVAPACAFFGRKDYQQALVIRRMCRDLDLPVEIVTCPIVREPDGLALSSRNRYLNPEDRVQALALRAAVLAMDRRFGQGCRDLAGLLAAGRSELAARDRVRPDYLEIRDPQSLAPRAGEARHGDLVAVAAWLGETRLIDNGLFGEEA
jgi:pantoate--beta-alanine ligase